MKKETIKTMMSSTRHTWKTPALLKENLYKFFNIDFDPCPTDPDFDGLRIEWKSRNYVNPPYGRKIGLWIRKSYKESRKGKLVVLLIPARTDTKYWHQYVMKAHEIFFIRGRLKFDDGKNPAPFPSAIVVFKGNIKRLVNFPIIRSLNADASSITDP